MRVVEAMYEVHETTDGPSFGGDGRIGPQGARGQVRRRRGDRSVGGEGVELVFHPVVRRSTGTHKDVIEFESNFSEVKNTKTKTGSALSGLNEG